MCVTHRVHYFVSCYTVYSIRFVAIFSFIDFLQSSAEKTQLDVIDDVISVTRLSETDFLKTVLWLPTFEDV